jgi:hypothetical protein
VCRLADGDDRAWSWSEPINVDRGQDDSHVAFARIVANHVQRVLDVEQEGRPVTRPVRYKLVTLGSFASR